MPILMGSLVRQLQSKLQCNKLGQVLEWMALGTLQKTIKTQWMLKLFCFVLVKSSSLISFFEYSMSCIWNDHQSCMKCNNVFRRNNTCSLQTYCHKIRSFAPPLLVNFWIYLFMINAIILYVKRFRTKINELWPIVINPVIVRIIDMITNSQPWNRSWV